MMRIVLQCVSMIALAGTVVPPCLFLAGKTDSDQVKLMMLASTFVWFIATPLWMGRPPKEIAKEVLP